MAIRFDSNSDQLQRLSTGLSLSAITACMCVRLSSDLNTFQTIFNYDHAGTGQYIQLSTDSDGTTMKVWASPSGIGTLLAMTVGTWYFIAVTMTGSTVTGYASALDGSALTSAAVTIGAHTGLADLEIGRDILNNAFRWDGQLCNLKVWNTVALSQADLEVERFFIMPQRTLNLYGWYPMLDAATAGTDYSGLGNNLTAGGTLTTEEHAPTGWADFLPRLYVPAVAATVRRPPGIQVVSAPIPAAALQ